MKDISKNPDAIPELKLGDIVLCDGQEFALKCFDGREMFFTSTDSISSEEFDQKCAADPSVLEQYDQFFTHIRRKSDQAAIMTKKDFLEILKKKAYYIG